MMRSIQKGNMLDIMLSHHAAVKVTKFLMVILFIYLFSIATIVVNATYFRKSERG